ncbi:unnamed protein product [Rotaria sp. Silwood1]|nr:unnamed protein product [Rotaria sp. Silwood1]
MNIIKYLIGKIVPKEVSIIQVVREGAGVLTLKKDDNSWIEKYALANLILDNEVFPAFDTELNFDYLNVQSHIIRTYLLLCHIKYQDISQKYVCFIPRKVTNAITTGVDGIIELDENYSVPLEDDWIHLNILSIDQLYYGYTILRQITSILKNEQRDQSSEQLYTYIQTINGKDLTVEILKENNIRDFQLCHMNHVGKLYKDLVGRFEHLFTDTSALLQRPMSNELSKELEESFQNKLINIDNGCDDKNLVVKTLESSINDIDELLNELKDIQDTLSDKGTESLAKICHDTHIKNSLLNIIGDKVKCENYVFLTVHLIHVRSKLQEKTIDFEEQNTEQWTDSFYEQADQTSQRSTRNRFRPDERDDEEDYDSGGRHVPGIVLNSNPEPDPLPSPSNQVHILSLFELNIGPTSIASLKSVFGSDDQTNNATTSPDKVEMFELTNPCNVPKFCIKCKTGTFYGKLKAHLIQKKYDMNTYAVVDYNKIFVDFTRTDARLPKPFPTKYCIVERSLLIPIVFQYGGEQYEYLTLSDCNVHNIIHRFIDEKELKQSPEVRLLFYDKLWKCIENEMVSELSHDVNHNLPVVIVVREENIEDSLLYTVNLQTKGSVCLENQYFKNISDYLNLDQEQKSLFHPTTKWYQIDIWRKTHLQQIDSSCVYINRESKAIFDKNESISMLEKNIVTLDGISEDQTRTVTLCFGSNVKVIRTLGSLRMHDLLSSDTLRQFSLIVLPEDCVFTLGDADEQELSEEDMKKLVEEFPQPIQCRIWLKVHIHQYDIQRDIVVKIKEDTITVDQILHMQEILNEDYKYLASSDRNAVIADDQKFVDLNETKFILLKENETCCVSIGDLNKAQEDGYSKRYAKFATIADVLKDSNVDADCLLCLNDIAPSKEIKLALLPPPIQFQIIKDDLLALVTVTNPEQENCSIQFKCSKSNTTGRIKNCEKYRL